MPPKIRVLIVDDAVVIRRMISDILNEDPEIEVVGVASNGHIALQRVKQMNPDVIALDVEMPELDGIQTVKALREEGRKVPIIMFSTLTERGAAATLEALAAGATDYVTKPSNVGSADAAIRKVRDELVPKIKAYAPKSFQPGVSATPELPATATAPAASRLSSGVPSGTASLAPPSAAPAVRRGPIGVVAIGVSTGGPNALAAIVAELLPNFPVPIVITQHMPPLFTRYLAERLNGLGPNECLEAADGMELKPGRILIAPGDYHLDVVRRGVSVVTRLHQSPPENSCRPAVDVMFRSVVEVYGNRTLGVILTGMGADGLRGCERIKEAGGYVLAQDEPTSVVWGMPGYVVKANLADEVLPLSAVASALGRRVRPSLGTPAAPAAPAVRARTNDAV